MKRSGLWAVGAIIFILTSCSDDDFNTIGTEVIGGKNFETLKADFDVFAATKELNSVRGNGLEVYQLGRLNNPVFGVTEAEVTSQVALLSGTPRFGVNTQQVENEGATDDIPTTIQENETVTKVFLNIPFFTNNSATNDRDGDGVINSLDSDPDDPNSDSDEDGLTDIQETAIGTNPLDPDTDGDGIEDEDDTDTVQNSFPRRFELDSIFGNKEATFNLKIDELTFFLRDLDPTSNFQESQEYFTNMSFSTFLGANFFNGVYQISDEETLVFGENDPDTPDTDESEIVTRRIPPGIRVELEPSFFQQNIIDKEGSQEIANTANLNNFFRGLHITTSAHTDDLLMVLNLTGATIEIQYTFDRVNQNGTLEDPSDDTIEKEEDFFNLGIGGNIVNTFVNDPLPSAIVSEIEKGTEASRIYLNGGAGTFVELNLFDEEGVTTTLEEVRANGWLINEANLVFNIDREGLDAAGNVIEPTRIYLYNLTNNIPIIDYLADPTQDPADPIDSRTIYGGVLETNSEGNGTEYKIKLTEHVNRILRNDSTNVKLGLAVTANINNFATVAGVNAATEEFQIPQASVINPFGTILFGGKTSTEEEEDKKLRLEIFYTEPKED